MTNDDDERTNVHTTIQYINKHTTKGIVEDDCVHDILMSIQRKKFVTCMTGNGLLIQLNTLARCGAKLCFKAVLWHGLRVLRVQVTSHNAQPCC